MAKAIFERIRFAGLKPCASTAARYNDAVIFAGQLSAKPRYRAIAASVVLHGAALLIICHRPAAIFAQPELLANGNGGRSARVVYLIPEPPARIVLPKSPRIYLARATPKLRQPNDAKSQHRLRTIDHRLNVAANNERAGDPLGEMADGFTHDLRPAIPVVFPDPPVARSDVPDGVQGDVVVQITVDVLGNVAGSRLVRGMGYGIEEKVMATVQNWHFLPATRDGRAVTSLHDVHFHYPPLPRA